MLLMFRCPFRITPRPPMRVYTLLWASSIALPTEKIQAGRAVEACLAVVLVGEANGITVNVTCEDDE